MGRGKNFTSAEHQYLVDNAHRLSAEEFAEYLGRSEVSIRSYASRKKITLRKDYYSPEEVSYIREHAGTKPWHEIASELGRPEQGVMVWASRNGVAGSQTHTPSRSKFTETRVCGGLFCEKEFSVVRGWQKYCSEKCALTIHHLKKYNIDKSRWWEIFNSQGRKCICGESDHPKSWHVDHDHSCCPLGRSCGKCVRGILCEDCNLSLGRLRDNPETLRRLAEYLERGGVIVG